MVHIPLAEDQDERIDDLVDRALGAEFVERVKNKMREIEAETETWLAYQLEENLASHIRSEAQLAAERFIQAVAEGREKECLQFIGDPPGLNDWQRGIQANLAGTIFDRSENSFGPRALRKAMIEACGEWLKVERIKDLEAEVAALREELKKADAELLKQRREEMMP